MTMIVNRMWLKLILLNKHRNKETHLTKHRKIISATKAPKSLLIQSEWICDYWPNHLIFFSNPMVCTFNLPSFGSELDYLYKVPKFCIYSTNTAGLFLKLILQNIHIHYSQTQTSLNKMSTFIAIVSEIMLWTHRKCKSVQHVGKWSLTLSHISH